MAQDIFKPYRIAYNELATYDKEKGNIFFITDKKLIYLDLDSEQRIQIMPTDVAELDNGSNYITRMVNNLANYYDKGEINYMIYFLTNAIQEKISFEDIYNLYDSIIYGGHVSSLADLPEIINPNRRSEDTTATGLYTISNLKQNINELHSLQGNSSNLNIRGKYISNWKEIMNARINAGEFNEIGNPTSIEWTTSAYIDNDVDSSIRWGITFVYGSRQNITRFWLFKGKTSYGTDVVVPIYAIPANSYAILNLSNSGWTVVDNNGNSETYKDGDNEDNEIVIFDPDKIKTYYIYPDVCNVNIDIRGINFLEYEDSWEEYCPGTTIFGTINRFTFYKDNTLPIKSYIENNSNYIFQEWKDRIALPEFDGFDGETTCILKNGAFLKTDKLGYMTYNFLNTDYSNMGIANLLFSVGTYNKTYYLPKDSLEYECWNEISSNSIIAALGYTPVDSANLGQANGIATLDSTGKVPSSQLPAFVDDVLEFATRSDFPATGESGKIYVALDTNLTYRWSGSTYVEISQSIALGETHSSAYYGDYGKVAYDHATAKGSAFTSNLYKITTNAEGHVSAASAMTQADFNTDYEIKPTAIVTLSKNNVSDKTAAEIQALVANNYNVIGKWESSTGRYNYLPLSTTSPTVSFAGIFGNDHPSISAGIYNTITIKLNSSGTGFTKTFKTHTDTDVGISIKYNSETPNAFTLAGSTNLGDQINQWSQLEMYVRYGIFLRYEHVNYQTQEWEDFIVPYQEHSVTNDPVTGDRIYAFTFTTIGNLGLPGDVVGGIYYYKFYIDSTSSGPSYIFGSTGTITRFRIDKDDDEGGVIPVNPDDTTNLNIWIETE